MPWIGVLAYRQTGGEKSWSARTFPPSEHDGARLSERRHFLATLGKKTTEWRCRDQCFATTKHKLNAGEVKPPGRRRRASLYPRLSAELLFCLRRNPSTRHPWGRMKGFSPDPNSHRDLDRRNNSRAFRKASNYRRRFFLPLFFTGAWVCSPASAAGGAPGTLMLGCVRWFQHLRLWFTW